jgi:hypothetical protein
MFPAAAPCPDLHLPLDPVSPLTVANRFPWDLVAGLLVMAALLVLLSRGIWMRRRAQAARHGAEPDRLAAYLLNGAAAVPALTAWLIWLLWRIAPLTPLDRALVALALAWVLAPFAAFGLSAAGEALTRPRSWPSTHV